MKSLLQRESHSRSGNDYQVHWTPGKGRKTTQVWKILPVGLVDNVGIEQSTANDGRLVPVCSQGCKHTIWTGIMIQNYHPCCYCRSSFWIVCHGCSSLSSQCTYLSTRFHGLQIRELDLGMGFPPTKSWYESRNVDSNSLHYIILFNEKYPSRKKKLLHSYQIARPSNSSSTNNWPPHTSHYTILFREALHITLTLSTKSQNTRMYMHLWHNQQHKACFLGYQREKNYWRIKKTSWKEKNILPNAMQRN